MGVKTKLQMRTDLATDLKITIDTELSAAELNRSIDRAYSDLSRMLPNEKIYEDSLQFAVADESLTFPKDTSLDAIVADEALTTSTDGDKATIDGQPDVPRPLTITLTDGDNSITGFTTIVNGIDKDDQALQEIFHFTLGDSKTIIGLKYFKAVFSVEFDQTDGNGAGDVFDLGYGAYTDVWVSLANSPLKWQSDTGVGDDDVAIVKNTDYYIDYANGRVKAISGGLIAAEEVCEFTYKKSQIGIDISGLADLIRVQRVEYPVGDVPQNFVQQDTFGKYVVITGGGEAEEQQYLAEDQQYRIYYDARHSPPGEYSPSTAPGFLEDTVLLAAGGFALLILALKQEHQVATDAASSRSSLTSATSEQSTLATALTNLKKYLDNNSEADAAGILKDITDDVTKLRTAIDTALNAANTFLDEVDTTDLQGAEGVWADYTGGSLYLTNASEPSVLAYLTSGDALLNTVAVGGEGQESARAYAEFARATRDALISVFELRRADWIRQANARINAGMGFVQEAAQRLANLRTYIEQAQGYVSIASTFAREAEDRIQRIGAYLQTAAGYTTTAAVELSLADRFREEAVERRNEAWSIWRDRKQYIGDFTAGSMRQMPDYK